MSRGFEDGHPLVPALMAAVPLHVMTLQDHGGPSDAEVEGCRSFAQVLAEKKATPPPSQALPMKPVPWRR